jgi:threonine/homoserine/homoserine lactone efflux protein
MYLLKGFIIGMLVSLPIGPLGLLAIQRTLNKGWKTGFLSAVGTATSELIYSSIAILGISFIDDFLKRHRLLITGLTGILFLIVGINILISGIEKRKMKKVDDQSTIHPIFIHFLLGLSNPLTFIIFFAIFTKLGIYVDDKNMLQHILFVLSIFSGSTILWFITTNVIYRTKKKFKFDSFIFIDTIIGIVIIMFGIFSVLRVVMRR